MTAPPAIELRGVVKRFGEAVGLDGVELCIETGATVALLGGNGSGKTTLLRVLAGLAVPDAGEVRLNGIDVVRERRRAAAACGMVGASEHTWALRLSGLENLQLFAGIRGMSHAAALSAAVRGLRRVGLAERADDPVGAYSRGMRARLAIARALLDEPPILLLDEPTANLDHEAASALFELLGDHARTVLLTTHLPADAELADRVVRLEDGHVAPARDPAGIR